MGPQPQPFTNDRTIAWRAVLPAFFATTAGILPGFLNAGLAVQIRAEIGLTLTELGVLIGMFFAIAGVLSPAAGRWAERHGWAVSLRVATLLTTVSLLGIAWLGNNMPSLAVFLLIGGVGGGLGQVASNLAVARCVGQGRQGFVLGLRHASVPAAAALAGAAVPTLALTVGWRWAFVSGAALAMAAGLSVPHNELRYTINPPRAGNSGAGRPATPTRVLIVLSIAVGVGIAGIDGFTAFLVSYSVDIGLAQSTAGLLLTVGSIAGMVSRLVVGWMIDRASHKDLTTIAGMIATGAAGVILLNYGGRFGLVAGALIMFAAGWGWSGLFTFAVIKDNPDTPAAATGVTQVGKYLGAAVGPPLFGFIADHASFRAAYWFTTTALVLALSLILYAREQRTA